ncbi:hypothetical protein, variant 1 [Aphanomyces astaci]|uniref:subtilisin n=1 Tax=Aphanomyces astaci TaxID=112090 RepID=W4GFL7_APHAT|nr:hypothetical protein, variant 1 [Aphanomyces astaci]ETV77758.1 hypothetical protein, variant 1 [Aphanomyces astaci]|eukprot:XP_009832869.1 hypothetical protein, variant 1 [Aphanomyces astaci]
MQQQPVGPLSLVTCCGTLPNVHTTHRIMLSGLSWAATGLLLVSLPSGWSLAFDSTYAWCQYHCSEFALAHPRNCSTCQQDDGMSSEGRRRHLEAAATSKASLNLSNASLNLIACDAHHLHVNMTTKGVGFHSFWTQFQQATDHILDSPTSLFLQGCDLFNLASLPSIDVAMAMGNATMALPVLVQLQRSHHEHECVEAIQSIASTATVVSRSNGIDHGRTVVLVHATLDQQVAMSSLACVDDQVLPLPPLFKFSPLARSLHAMYSTASPAVHIALVDGASSSGVLASLNAGLKSTTGIHNLVTFDDDGLLGVPPLTNFKTWATAIALACSHPLVDYVTRTSIMETFDLPLSSYTRSSDYSSDQISSIVGIDNAHKHGILGHGVVVGISDSGLYMDHDQFDQPSPREFGTINPHARKVVLYEPMADRVDQSKSVTCGHGSHVSGILAGSSWSQLHPDVGVAPQAKIAFTDIGSQNASCANNRALECPVKLTTPLTAAALMDKQVQAGAKIFSYSWGTQKDDYSRQAQNLDEYLFNHPEILVVIAAGNGGDDGVRTISSPAGAKNVITVGASLTSADSLLAKFRCPRVYNPQSVASFSSQGPTSDGRMKPDLVAPGEVLWSAKSEAPGSTAKTSDVCPLQGTSQATPVVAGMAVLIYEWLRDGWWHEGVYDISVGMTYIPASLIKALLVHSSNGLVRRLDHNKVHQACDARTSVPLHYPDMSQGYGLPNMSNVAFFSSDDPIVKFWPNALQPAAPLVAHHSQDSYPATLTRHQVFRATLVNLDRVV